jgi:hypothetical protein
MLLQITFGPEIETYAIIELGLLFILICWVAYYRGTLKKEAEAEKEKKEENATGNLSVTERAELDHQIQLEAEDLSQSAQQIFDEESKPE